MCMCSTGVSTDNEIWYVVLSFALSFCLASSMISFLLLSVRVYVYDTSCIIALPHLIVDDFHFMLHFKNLCVLMATVTHAAHYLSFHFSFSPFYLQTFLPFICLFVRSFVCLFAKWKCEWENELCRVRALQFSRKVWGRWGRWLRVNVRERQRGRERER